MYGSIWEKRRLVSLIFSKKLNLTIIRTTSPKFIIRVYSDVLGIVNLPYINLSLFNNESLLNNNYSPKVK